jgi:hypothetical protein
MGVQNVAFVITADNHIPTPLRHHPKVRQLAVIPLQ